MRHRIDVAHVDRSRPGARGGQARNAATGREIEHALARGQMRMVDQVAGDRQAAGPGKGPEGRVHVVLGEPGLGRLPEGDDGGGEVELQFGHERRRLQRGVGQDEGVMGRRPAGRPMARCIGRPILQPHSRRGLRTRRRQPAARPARLGGDRAAAS